MPRKLKFQRLNMHPRRRWAMLKQMSESLFVHERIITTSAKAKAVATVINNIFATALKNNRYASMKINGYFHTKGIHHKMFSYLINEYRPYKGGILKVEESMKRRRGDNAKMVQVELIHK